MGSLQKTLLATRAKYREWLAAQQPARAAVKWESWHTDTLSARKPDEMAFDPDKGDDGSVREVAPQLSHRATCHSGENGALADVRIYRGLLTGEQGAKLAVSR
jgi:hypothetical protein